jgi:hypothetical protein
MAFGGIGKAYAPKCHRMVPTKICFIQPDVSSQKIGGNKLFFAKRTYMSIEVRGKAPNFNAHIVCLALHHWGLP